MSRTKEVVTAAGTLACALGIGFVMQSTETASQRYGAPTTPQAEPPAQAASQVNLSQVSLMPKPVVRPNHEQVAVIDVQGVKLTSAMAETSDIVTPEPAMQLQAEPVPEPMPAMQATDACEIRATATATTAARALLNLTAPCHTDARVTVHHGGMLFTEQTDADGALSLTVPGLAEQAVFIFAFADGDGAVTQTSLPDIAAFNRVVLQWRGLAGFELHAREFGAAYGTKGHVWKGADDGSLDRLQKGTGGTLANLGRADVSEPHFAEIYSFPASMSGRNGQIDLSVEAEITSANCGLEIEAQTLEREGAGEMITRTLTLAVPGCDAVGDYLVLNNVFDDMKVAAR